ncbi:Predicted Fe2+/Mn2+ transporter, VIT1/CCC1 family [Actinopolyspora xinjiangensis]|uniref:Predicted Fe2+/Mn2+ transporter, VIT1/CCC1 family n=1 Tax=Actinopolyspora xinjiangensis TaxID=405564 RepID=A0A1H0RRW7_9ACTN|nr:VIT1/CCC1 family protein [Actinopolyspora xinjiangensis]SDP32207.1 Predicted Fe2+/Mn2+ transporter, VIT1/CCC1 family [Actinopolyspora xinjiangensis]
MSEHPTADRPRPSAAELRAWRRMLADERAEAAVYRQLAERRHGEEREILLRLAEAEQRHADHWRRLLGEHVGEPRRATLRMRLLAFLARGFGWIFVLALVQHAENRSYYEFRADATEAMAADERVHGEVVRALAAQGRARMSGTLRAAVFGINDGVVSNLALVLGVIGGGASPTLVVLTGLSGLLAGALSMAAGEYVSVSSQRELIAAGRPDDTAGGVLPRLDVDANELALVYRARGMSASEAERRAEAMLSRSVVERSPAREESDGEEVVGSGIKAAASSFAAFAVGALLPVLPFLMGLDGVPGVLVAGGLSGAALSSTGATVGVLSGVSPLPRALRQLGIGAGAAGLTFLLGLLFGVTAS